MFTIDQGYYAAYNFLARYWKDIDRKRTYLPNDSFTLATVISTMQPQSIDDPRSIDPAKYYDWKNVIATLFPDKIEFTEKEIFEAAVRFLEFYRDEFEFNLAEVLAGMQSDQTQAIWQQTVGETRTLIAGNTK